MVLFDNADDTQAPLVTGLYVDKPFIQSRLRCSCPESSDLCTKIPILEILHLKGTNIKELH